MSDEIEMETVAKKVEHTVGKIPGWIHIVLIVLGSSVGTEGIESYMGRNNGASPELIREEVSTQVATQITAMTAEIRASLGTLQASLSELNTNVSIQSQALRDNRCEIEHIKAATDWRQCYGPRPLP